MTTMKIKKSIVQLLTVLSLVTFITACTNDAWDEHYSAVPSIKSELNTFDYIKSQSNLTKFTQMLELTGYDSILSQSQTFTVWAPVDESLTGVDMDNLPEVTKIVTNHITRYSHPSSEVSKKARNITMLNSKLIEFKNSATGFTFDSKAITTPDIATKNGIIHILSQYVAYKRNFWEFINETPGLDSLKTYLNNMSILELDNDKSYEDGVFVDSIFKQTNFILDYVAALNVEDSIYTGILPDNQAWITAYNAYFPYFKTLPAEGGVAVQRQTTLLRMVYDKFYSGLVSDKTDTIINTIGNKFADPQRFFTGTQVHTLSNGVAHITSEFKNKPTETWLAPIKVEAERSSEFRTASYYTLSENSAIGSGLTVSKGNYLQAFPTAGGDVQGLNSMYVRIPISGTLSAKYNIYCVFVPPTVISSNEPKPSKVKFFFSYINASGAQKIELPVNATNNVEVNFTGTNTQAIAKAAPFETKGSEMYKMLVVKEFQFPFTNIRYDAVTGKYTPTVFLRINNAAKFNETAYTRTLRIDCIILEPVE